MVVITVPAKKKELPKSQWLIWVDVFPKGMIPAFIAATTCCKSKKIFVNIHETMILIHYTVNWLNQSLYPSNKPEKDQHCSARVLSLSQATI